MPLSWDYIAHGNIFLSTAYLSVLESSAPRNMKCRFIGLFAAEELVGVAMSQQLSLSEVDSFGGRDRRFKTHIRKITFSKVASNVLLIGNNMLTGQNAFVLSDKISFDSAAKLLENAVEQIKRESNRIHLTIFKDFYHKEITQFDPHVFSNYTEFSTQPNMVFHIKDHWHSVDDYVSDLSKKYRDQYKRARKKLTGITKRKLVLEEMTLLQSTIHQLYLNVAKQAPFNTFYLTGNHFATMKQRLGSDFLFYGYFLDEKLIGFSTLIKNGDDFDTYFLGYDETHQRDKMLYLNMLYDMISYAMKKKYRKVNFGRTALEIKSSIGATDIEMYGLIKHSNPIFNKLMPYLFDYFEPKTVWQKRNPFKERQS